MSRRAGAEARASRSSDRTRGTRTMRTLAQPLVKREYSPSGRLRAKLFGTPKSGKVIGNPAVTVALWVQGALRAPRRPDCVVYAPDGSPVAIIDGETRQRRPYASEGRRETQP